MVGSSPVTTAEPLVVVPWPTTWRTLPPPVSMNLPLSYVEETLANGLSPNVLSFAGILMPVTDTFGMEYWSQPRPPKYWPRRGWDSPGLALAVNEARKACIWGTVKF